MSRLRLVITVILLCALTVSISSCNHIGREQSPTKTVPVKSTEPAQVTSMATAALASTPASHPSPIVPAAVATAQIPTLGAGSILIPSESSAAPPIRKYVCPWLEMPGDIPHYSYKILHTYPHDIGAYTEGLVYLDGYMYESTGLHGQSSLRKLELETGRVLQIQNLPQEYFGEGIALFRDQAFMLTWKEETGFIFDLTTFDLIEHFAYSSEGWGLTDDDHDLIMSDGSSRLTFLQPDTLKALKTLQVASDGAEVEQLNELEYINAEIWANVYLTSCVARINPDDGHVLGWIDLSGMLSRDEMAYAEVPNGIAFDPQTGRIYVTGKFWPKVFEIELIPLQRIDFFPLT
jgi:glutamine cyclotransferase